MTHFTTIVLLAALGLASTNYAPAKYPSIVIPSSQYSPTGEIISKSGTSELVDTFASSTIAQTLDATTPQPLTALKTSSESELVLVDETTDAVTQETRSSTLKIEPLVSTAAVPTTLEYVIPLSSSERPAESLKGFPYPGKESFPYPAKESFPYPAKESFPYPAKESFPYPAKESFPYPAKESFPYPPPVLIFEDRKEVFVSSTPRIEVTVPEIYDHSTPITIVEEPIKGSFPYPAALPESKYEETIKTSNLPTPIDFPYQFLIPSSPALVGRPEITLIPIPGIISPQPPNDHRVPLPSSDYGVPTVHIPAAPVATSYEYVIPQSPSPFLSTLEGHLIVTPSPAPTIPQRVPESEYGVPVPQPVVVENEILPLTPEKPGVLYESALSVPASEYGPPLQQPIAPVVSSYEYVIPVSVAPVSPASEYGPPVAQPVAPVVSSYEYNIPAPTPSVPALPVQPVVAPASEYGPPLAPLVEYIVSTPAPIVVVTPLLAPVSPASEYGPPVAQPVAPVVSSYEYNIPAPAPSVPALPVQPIVIEDHHKPELVAPVSPAAEYGVPLAQPTAPVVSSYEYNIPAPTPFVPALPAQPVVVPASPASEYGPPLAQPIAPLEDHHRPELLAPALPASEYGVPLAQPTAPVVSSYEYNIPTPLVPALPPQPAPASPASEYGVPLVQPVLVGFHNPEPLLPVSPVPSLPAIPVVSNYEYVIPGVGDKRREISALLPNLIVPQAVYGAPI